MKFLNWFLTSGEASARLVRTLVEVMLSWLLANIGDVTGLFNLKATPKALLISAFTIIITAVIGFINDGKKVEQEEEE